ncbi:MULTISPECIES: hypothetical protein [Limnospira]|uniref:Uncharacterized protein n=1 Tax=Limnospira indica PCC 8005 TaxID=376219 RepID=A0A9P1NZM8_9CYAN|nr:hypothetical protein HFV01_09190 [Limnospira fusiformis SAG 85.79]QNH56003.1 MAG: hypothetical protein H2674_16570 [Limnospira indica BM01]CDM96050.1 protein of unknown function [Limnospira indica PCC 8005]
MRRFAAAREGEGFGHVANPQVVRAPSVGGILHGGAIAHRHAVPEPVVHHPAHPKTSVNYRLKLG